MVKLGEAENENQRYKEGIKWDQQFFLKHFSYSQIFALVKSSHTSRFKSSWWYQCLQLMQLVKHFPYWVEKQHIYLFNSNSGIDHPLQDTKVIKFTIAIDVSAANSPRSSTKSSSHDLSHLRNIPTWELLRGQDEKDAQRAEPVQEQP